jgi:hypothetical protein
MNATETAERQSTAHSPKRFLRDWNWILHRWWFWVTVAVVAVLVVLHLYLAIWVRDYVNRKLSEIPGYRAHVSAVTLHLWRGAYQIHNINISKTSGSIPVPFFSAPLIDLSVQWHALIFEHAAVGNIDVQGAQMNIVNGRSKDNRQVDVDAPWAEKIKQLYPLKINRFVVHNGEIHYRDYSQSPDVDVVIDRVQMVATNLTNSKKLSKNLIADIRMEGRPLRAGKVRSQISLDPYARRPTFAFNLEVAELPLVKVNNLSKAYGNFTFDAGTLKLAMEASARDGAYRGWVEPVFDHMEISAPEKSDNPLTALWKVILEGVTHIVRNHPKDRFGTRIPFSGTFEDPRPDIFETVFNAFRNAFVKAFEGTLNEKNEKLPPVNTEKQ